MRAGDTRRVACITSDRYEPFVALRKSARTPPFDERFVGYGKNKVQMLVHLRHAGFGFEVLREPHAIAIDFFSLCDIRAHHPSIE